MSFLGGRGAAPSGGVNADRMEMAVQESVQFMHSFPYILIDVPSRLDMITDVFNRLVSSVFLLASREHFACN
jgi:hypothetical protein